MPLLYTVVSRRNVVLAKNATTVGNFAEVTDAVLSKIDRKNNKRMSYASGTYMYHYMAAPNDLVFLCIADDSFRRSAAFRFLDAVHSRFETEFGQRGAITAAPFSLNTEFAPVLASEMKRFNLAEDQNKLMPSDDYEGASEEGDEDAIANVDKVQRVRDEVERVKDIMVQNIDNLVERGERLELLVDKTEHLSQNSIRFKQTSTTLRRRMWWQNKRLYLGVGLAVLIGIYIVVSVSCGGLAWPKCVGSK